MVHTGLAAPNTGTSRLVQIPVSLTEWATLQIPHPMTKDMWNQMVTILRAMKPGLVRDADSERPYWMDGC